MFLEVSLLMLVLIVTILLQVLCQVVEVKVMRVAPNYRSASMVHSYSS